MMKELNWKFDLQIFAEDVAGAENSTETENETGNETGSESPETGAENNNQAPAGATILGGAGIQQSKDGEEGKETGTPNANQPNVPDAYDFKSIEIPEGMEYDEESAKAFGEVARKAGLSQEQAASIASYGMQYLQHGVDMAMQQITATQQQWGEAAKKELGAQFDATVAKAAIGIDALETKVPGLRAVLNETGAGNRIEMIRMMAAVGELVGEDRGVSGGTAAGHKTAYPNTNFDLYK